MHLYVYYKARSAHAARLQDAVARMQAGLGVPASLLRRPEEQNGLQTWMEAYAQVPAGFAELLDTAVSAAGLAALIEGPRHAEWFEEVSACA